MMLNWRRHQSYLKIKFARECCQVSNYLSKIYTDEWLQLKLMDIYMKKRQFKQLIEKLKIMLWQAASTTINLGAQYEM